MFEVVFEEETRRSGQCIHLTSYRVIENDERQRGTSVNVPRNENGVRNDYQATEKRAIEKMNKNNNKQE